MMLSKNLGRWAAIDIETTGIDPHYDEIIDVGYYLFEGTQLVETYDTLVQTQRELSQFIQKLTGIKPSMLKHGITQNEMKLQLSTLEDCTLMAHNAAFENMYLSPILGDKNDYADTLYFLGLIHPGRSSLNLESFLIDYGIAEKEDHRGLSDSLAMLKVLISACYHIFDDSHRRSFIRSLLNQHMPAGYWFTKFFSLEKEELVDIAGQLGFHPKDYKLKNKENQFEINSNSKVNADLSFSGSSIEKNLSNEKQIGEFLPGYHLRSEQLQLAKKVGQAFHNNVHAIVQAPTGTGKTLGYLIPAALYSINHEEAVLISTGTKALQEQALSKDVPVLRRILGLDEKDLRVTQLIGSSNHLCELQFRRQLEEQGALLDALDDFEKGFTKAYFELLFYENAQRNYQQMFTRMDIPFSYKMNLGEFKQWDSDLAVDYRACISNQCPHKQTCSYLSGLREAKEAHLIIGNHALSLSWPRGVPRPTHVVVDEAHKLESEVTQTFTVEFSQKGVESFMRQLNQMQGLGALFYLLAFDENSETQVQKLRDEARSTLEMMADHMHSLPDLVESYFKKMPRYTSDYWNERPMLTKESANDSLSVSIFNHFLSLYNILEPFYAKLLPYMSRWEVKEFNGHEQKLTAFSRFEAFYSGLEDLLNGLKMSLENSDDYSSTFAYKESEGFALQTSPIDVGRVIFNEVLTPSSSVVFTSATLANSDGSMGVNAVEWITGYTYLDPKKRFEKGLYLPPIFDYENNAKVFICTDVPSLYDQNFVPVILERVRKMIINLGGRTLILFSARKRFEQAREWLLKEFDGKIPVYIQGMGSNVVEDFKNSSSGILLGMEAFGEGIDIPGDDLQFLLIDKVPDVRQDLVIQRRRDYFESRFGNEFVDYFMANRTRSLHQKIGRLIRRTSDRGGAIVVDARLKKWKGRTLEQFKKLMRPYNVNFSTMDQAVEEIQEFLKE